jgi:hypothetical protein
MLVDQRAYPEYGSLSRLRKWIDLRENSQESIVSIPTYGDKTTAGFFLRPILENKTGDRIW